MDAPPNIQTVLFGLLIAITTAFITALLNNYYWRRQLKDTEKSEYRKLYLRKKLETHEHIVTYFSENRTKIWVLLRRLQIANSIDDCRKHGYFKELRIVTDELGKLMDDCILYISKDVWDTLRSMVDIIIETFEAKHKGMSIDENTSKIFSEKINRLNQFLKHELGIAELLDSADLPRERLEKLRAEEIDNSTYI